MPLNFFYGEPPHVWFSYIFICIFQTSWSISLLNPKLPQTIFLLFVKAYFYLFSERASKFWKVSVYFFNAPRDGQI